MRLILLLRKTLFLAGFATLTGGLAGCSEKSFDYRAFRASHPRSVLVLPPVNQSTDVSATYSVLSGLTHPLAEAGYYVIPVADMDETFRQNGLVTPADIQTAPIEKLYQVFGADSALYTTIKQHDTTYRIISTTSTVSLSARLVDLKTGTLLWKGTATAKRGRGGIGPFQLIANAFRQISATIHDDIHPVALDASEMLLNPEAPEHQSKKDGILPGPYKDKIKPKK